MEYRKLGRTGLDVSVICLGTMTWGEQNTEVEAHEQMDYALDQGVNFLDTAELYPVPPKEETQGRTEEYIGTWFEKTGNRDKVILATKVVGKSESTYFRGNGEVSRMNARHITDAVDKSLKRLKTDYIDLYQLHWPERSTNFFGKLGYNHVEDEDTIELQETLEALDGLVKSGKIRHVGLSNESAWGTMKYLALSEKLGLPRMASVQNPYNLLNRSYEVGLAEVSIREECGLLAYSPLAMGMLSGKYLGGQMPEGSRFSLFTRFQRYTTEVAYKMTEKYVALAKENGLDPSQMALAFINSRRFVTSNIIGATTMAQLETNIGSIDIQLSEDILKSIEDIHSEHPYPCP
ncbi:NADP(H)-dependent aldo-keto reductase [Sneathiella sp. P13V-1]|uniref:NADP(H)-dependent aldo-keto reductase n=1 Tax=Sneathiella sp. P13V-1 TaxID=2697366 RepID=UPI00187B6E2D|nr:NADP(H)-dependent aldo-keto reductase [Sneathiella sp. P13V-1]MBE7636442.1 NADP(H)-dependent aldo-keto reductase [Sneathiella sp. P13V-1]